MTIRSLDSHPAHYVTVAELAEYWAVSRQQIYKRIESGSLNAIRLGARLYRVRTREALEFEQRATINSAAGPENGDAATASERTELNVKDKLPKKVGLQRVRGITFPN